MPAVQVGTLNAGPRYAAQRCWTARWTYHDALAGEPDKLIAELAEDEAIAAADTLLLTVPNQLGVDYNAHVLDSVITHLAPELGWR